MTAGTAFTDLTQDWYKQAVAWASANDITKGVTETTFNPDGKVTREQAAAFLKRYAEFKGYDTSASAELSGFTDANSVSGWAVESMKWSLAAGLISGRTATTIVPKGESTRAEVATLLMRFCGAVVK